MSRVSLGVAPPSSSIFLQIKPGETRLPPRSSQFSHLRIVRSKEDNPPVPRGPPPGERPRAAAPPLATFPCSMLIQEPCSHSTKGRSTTHCVIPLLSSQDGFFRFIVSPNSNSVCSLSPSPESSEPLQMRACLALQIHLQLLTL